MPIVRANHGILEHSRTLRATDLRPIVLRKKSEPGRLALGAEKISAIAGLVIAQKSQSRCLLHG